MIQRKNNLTIKRLYDQYSQTDFNYYSNESVNLNPKREITLEQLDKVIVGLQKLTDSYVLKKIAKPL